MIALTIIYIALVAGLALWAWPLLAGSRWPRITLGVLLLTYAGLYLAGTEMLARPKPIGLELFARGRGEAEILAMAVDPGNAVYFWLRLPSGSEPRAYVMPWSDKAMEAVQKARDETARTGENMRLQWGEEGQVMTMEGDFSPDPGGGTTVDPGDEPGVWWPFENSYSDWTGMIHPMPQPRDPYKPRP